MLQIWHQFWSRLFFSSAYLWNGPYCWYFLCCYPQIWNYFFSKSILSHFSLIEQVLAGFSSPTDEKARPSKQARKKKQKEGAREIQRYIPPTRPFHLVFHSLLMGWSWGAKRLGSKNECSMTIDRQKTGKRGEKPICICKHYCLFSIAPIWQSLFLV